LVIGTLAGGATPRVTDDRYKLELVASEPEIVTPIGLAFDRKGRLLVIESHTHHRPEGYEGASSDRIRMLVDSTGTGIGQGGQSRLDNWSTFAEGFRHAMNLLACDDGAVYLVTRGHVLLLRDTDDDGVADQQQMLLRLETKDDYPHNGLGGIDQDSDGSLIIGLGENHGLLYKLIGADGKVIEGTGGLDGFYRMSAGGTGIEHLARGVWNPFSLCVVPDGRIFAVDNDPDASPPCRLLHVVPGGDYGYLYQYGRAGTHPLQAWNGELPGTLPMVCGTGEAPTGIVDHAGSLWVTSWGDHAIERYRLVPHGASYTAKREIVVQGDADFRPSGIAVAPDGSLYFGDWVKRDYQVHGHGRIWRLVLPPEESTLPFSPRSEEDRQATSLTTDRIGSALASNDPYLHTAGVALLAKCDNCQLQTNLNPRLRLGWLEAQRLRGLQRSECESMLRSALADESPDVRLFAVRWIADERITTLRDEVARLLDEPPPSPRYYLAVLAAVDWLDYEPQMRDKDIADELLVRELEREDRSSEAKALALSLLSPNHKFLIPQRLHAFLQSDAPALQLEAVRALALRSGPERFDMLAEVAQDKTRDDAVRLEAIMGLAAAAEQFRELLQSIVVDGDPVASREAERVLRLAGLKPAKNEVKPPIDDMAIWNLLVAKGGDPAAGRRLFFSAVGARCAVCHQHLGRGGRVGPDLTRVGHTRSRERILESILKPNHEVAPHYQPWVLTTNDGKTHLGLRLPQGGDDGIERYVDSQGNLFSLPSETIISREVSPISIMPEGLQNILSISDLRDLVSFLASPAE
jgi:putative membrane-bound dehydrogenase-like protein